MVICKFFQEGRCKYGDSCRYEHPGGRNSFQQQTNRFAPLTNQGGSTGFGARGRSGNVEENTYHLIVEDIRNDVTYQRDRKEGERPLYPFGAYGPGRNAPKQLIEGDLEISPEELRVQAYIADATGAIQQFQAQYAQIEALMNAKVQQIINNTEDAKRYASDTSPPNRNDIVVKPAAGTWPWRVGQTHTSTSGGFGSALPVTGGFGAASRPAFGGSSQPAFGALSAPGAGNAFGGGSSTGGFGAPSALGAKPSPFAGGAAATPSTGFGAPSALGAKPSPFGGQPAAGGFGAPSALGQKASPFGGAQPAAAAPTTGAFGAPSSLGAKPSPFGAPQQAAAGGFGAPSAMGQTSSPFGGAAQPATGGFGAAPKPAFGSSGFGAAAAPATGGFGSQQPSAQTSTPFGGSQAQTAGTAFGAPSAFGANRPSPFAQPGQQQQTGLDRPNPFAAKPPTGPAAQTGTGAGFGFGSTGFGGTSGQSQTPQTASFGTNNVGPGTSQQQQGISATTFKGKPIVTDEKLHTPGYHIADSTKPNGTGIERIWFPDGHPDISEKLNSMTEAPAAVYEDPAIGPKLKEIYEWTAQHGTFVKDGAIVMPEIPPKREWCVYDF